MKGEERRHKQRRDRKEGEREKASPLLVVSVVRGKTSQSFNKASGRGPRGRMLEPLEGRSTNPDGGIKHKGLEELEAKVHGVASWMNAGRTLSGRTEQQAEGKS